MYKQASLHRIGRSVSSSSDYLNEAIWADVHFVDELALDHTSFKETELITGYGTPRDTLDRMAKMDSI